MSKFFTTKRKLFASVGLAALLAGSAAMAAEMQPNTNWSFPHYFGSCNMDAIGSDCDLSVGGDRDRDSRDDFGGDTGGDGGEPDPTGGGDDGGDGGEPDPTTGGDPDPTTGGDPDPTTGGDETPGGNPCGGNCNDKPKKEK